MDGERAVRVSVRRFEDVVIEVYTGHGGAGV